MAIGKWREETEEWLRRVSASTQHHLLSIYYMLGARGPLLKQSERESPNYVSKNLTDMKAEQKKRKQKKETHKRKQNKYSNLGKLKTINKKHNNKEKSWQGSL